MTWNVLVAVLPRLSGALQFTACVPIENALPDAGRQVTPTAPSTRSTAVGSENETAAPDGPVASIGPTSACSEMAGGVVSATVTVNVSLATLWWVSVAEQVTIVSPKPKTVPDAGVHDTVTFSSTRSIAVGGT